MPSPLPLQAAKAAVLAECSPLEPETCALFTAHGERLAEPVLAAWDHPAGDNAAMDGYAVRSEDLVGASIDQPATLRVVGLSRAGEAATVGIGAGEAVRIFTGGLVPEGADAVVIQEATGPVDGHPDLVAVRMAVAPGENVRCAGEEYRAGDRLLEAGDRLTPAAIGLLASAGLTEVRVVRRPRVALLGIGDELVSDEVPAGAAFRFDSNGPMLAAAVAEANAMLLGASRCRDDAAEVASWLRDAAEGADVLVSSGSASVGEFDVVGAAWAAASVRRVFAGVAIKPGRPCHFGVLDGRRRVLVFALPGNPLAALTGFEQLVAPCLEALGGGRPARRPRLRLPLAEGFGAKRPATYLVRSSCQSGPVPRLEVPARQGAAMLREAARQPLLTVIEGPVTLPAGAPVEAEVVGEALADQVVRIVPPLPGCVGVQGPSGVGKTRLVEQLLPVLAGRGLRVGTVKHATHPVQADRTGSDSHRHRAAGAVAVLLVGPAGTVWSNDDTPAELADLLEPFAGQADLVLIEGFKALAIDRVVLSEGAGGFSLTSRREEGRLVWEVTRPAADGPLDYPAELLGDLAERILAVAR